ncbi:hypothetical protein KHQ81_05735 [Mycoplasmatota bacterium]|nr:hypothetical protein KHQ81_05735 [Mycoplasmatota bacterium]
MINKRGFFLPYTFFLLITVLNMVIFVVLCNLNTNNYYNEKNNYYHTFILEERAKRHIEEKITLNQVNHNESELLYYDEDFIYLTYQYDSTYQLWKISMRIKYKNIDEYGTIYYYLETKKIILEIR